MFWLIFFNELTLFWLVFFSKLNKYSLDWFPVFMVDTFVLEYIVYLVSNFKILVTNSHSNIVLFLQNVYNSYKLLTPFIPSFVKTILKSKGGTKDMYLLLIRNNIESNGQKIFSLGFRWNEMERNIQTTFYSHTKYQTTMVTVQN